MSHPLKARGHGLQRWRRALGYSWDGLKSAADEAGFRELLLLHAVLLLLLPFLRLALALKLVLLLGSLLSLICELFNTAIEACVDLISPDIHPLATRATAVASAAQYLSLLLLALLWALALIFG